MLRLSAIIIACLPLAALADPTRLGVGVAMVPQYPGADEYRIIPAPSFAFSLGNVEVRSNGPGVEVDLISRRGFDAGPVLRYNGGRDPGNIDNAAVSALPQIDGSIEAGAFAALTFPLAERLFVGPRVEVRQGLDGGHEGLIATGSINAVRPSGDWVFGGSLSATYADDSYMGAFFGVGAGSASGLPAYAADAGFKDVGLRAFAIYQLDDNWGVGVIAGVTRLVGDAADSPIVTQTGSATQGFLSVGVSYTFD